VRRTLVVAGSAAAPASRPVPAADAVTGLADHVTRRPTRPPAPEATPDDLAHLAFTGGTTGVSKSVRVLNRNVVANVCKAVAWRGGAQVSMGDGKLELVSFGRDDIGLREGQG
jgi:long-chain acyl-CoA synthetase